MIKEDETFVITDENGKDVVCHKLFTFDSTETGKSYMAYTQNEIDESGKLIIYAAIYDPKDPNSKLLPVESEKEMKVINTIYNAISESLNGQN